MSTYFRLLDPRPSSQRLQPGMSFSPAFISPGRQQHCWKPRPPFFSESRLRGSFRGRLSRFRVVPLAWTTAAIGICVVAGLDILIHSLVVH